MFVWQCGPNIDWLETSDECINIFWVGHMCHDRIIVSSWYQRIVPLKCSEYPNLSPFLETLENPFLENPLGSRVTMGFSENRIPPNLIVYQFYFPILWVLLYPQLPTNRNMRLLVRSLKSSFNSFQKKRVLLISPMIFNFEISQIPPIIPRSHPGLPPATRWPTLRRPCHDVQEDNAVAPRRCPASRGMGFKENSKKGCQKSNHLRF